MVKNNDPLQMRVSEAKHRDIGKKRARIGPDAMDYLQVTPGDIIQIIGKKSTCAIVWPSDEDEKYPDTIRIDGQTRKNVDVGLNDVVEIRKNTTKPAKSITLMPINDTVTVDKEFSDFVKNRLKCLPLSQGDEISVMILGNAMNFKIDKISPKGVVRIERSTSPYASSLFGAIASISSINTILGEFSFASLKMSLNFASVSP